MLFTVGVIAGLGPKVLALFGTMFGQLLVLPDVGVSADHIDFLRLFLIISAHEAGSRRLIHFICSLLQYILFQRRLLLSNLGYSLYL